MKLKKPKLSKVTSKGMLSKVLVPVGVGMLGSVAGAAAGRTYNLGLAAVLGAAALAFENPNLTYAAVGAAVVTPSKTVTPTVATAGLNGLAGFKDKVLLAKNRGFGQVKNLLSNAHLDVVADKIPVSGIEGLGDLGDAYESGYLQGSDDTEQQYIESDGVQGLSGTTNYFASQTLPSGSGERVSVEAMRMRSL